MSDPITRLNAALKGRYRIERQLGEGGMATVHLADDLRHERKVALKVLKPELAAVVGAERFLAEIKTTANLQHPHILPLFDSGEADKFLFYVMPYVEGESLRDRLDREHQLPVDEAVAIASKVAGALQAAHERGVIHRDIKPANILLSKGEPLVSDFGIALAVTAGGAGRLTETGLSLGTPHYMSPEQATGDQSVGAATDIYALGCVLYEMLVGEPPYTGSTPQAVLGKIVTGEADPVTKHRKSVPPNVDAAIRNALEKVPADRFASAKAFAECLADPGFRHGERIEESAKRRSGRWPFEVLGAALVGVAATALWFGTRPPPPGEEMHFEIPLPADGLILLDSEGRDIAISRDGRRIAYVSAEPGGAAGQVYLRSIDDLEWSVVRGSEGSSDPFFSPDGEWVGLIQDARRRVVRVSSVGGAPVTVGTIPAVASRIWGASWDDDGIIVGTVNGLYRFSPDGGEPEALTSAIDGSVQHHWPSPIEGTDAVLFAALGASFQLAVLDRRNGEVKLLGLAGTNPRYISTGHVVYASFDGTLFAVPFDVGSLEITGSPRPVLEGVGVTLPSGRASFDVSSTGHLIYRQGVTNAAVGRTNLVAVGLDGTPSQLAEIDGAAWFPRFSPDGTQIAFGLSNAADLNGDADLWALEIARDVPTRLTFGGNNRFYPIWTPDGARIVYADGAENLNHLLWTSTDGAGVVDTLLPLGDRRYPTSWSPDGSTLAYHMGPNGTPTNSRDIWLLHSENNSWRPEPFIETPFSERGAVFSPNGRWLAYVSDKSGQNDVYVLPYPGPGEEIRISDEGGGELVWAPSGNELYYRSGPSLMVVGVDTEGPDLSPTPPKRLFDDGYTRDIAGAAGAVANFDIAPDGSWFVMVEDPGTLEGARASTRQLDVILNWTTSLASP